MTVSVLGAYADTTTQLMTLVKAVLDRGRAVVAAIQTSTEVSCETDELDDEIDL